MEPPEPVNPLEQRSAAWCHTCKRRRVQTLVFRMPVMNDTMDEHALMAAAHCGPEIDWLCPCGELTHANRVVEGW
jgi:hypothetical protein